MANKLDLTIGGKTYRVTFSRDLSFDERRHISATDLSGNVSTPAEVRKVVETMFGLPNETLAVLDVQEAPAIVRG